MVVSAMSFDFPIDGEGAITADLLGLYHSVYAPGSQKNPDGSAAKSIAEIEASLAAASPGGYTQANNTYTLRDAKLKTGTSEEELTSLAGFKFTFDNGVIEDFRSTHRPGNNVDTIVKESLTHKLWYPQQYKYGPQTVSGTIDLNSTQAAMELNRMFVHAEKLVFTVGAGPTTLEAATAGKFFEETMTFVISLAAPTGGGAEPLKREGDQYTSVNFNGSIDPATSKDFSASFASAAEVKVLGI
jgi:hypothetical protein